LVSSKIIFLQWEACYYRVVGILLVSSRHKSILTFRKAVFVPNLPISSGRHNVLRLSAREKVCDCVLIVC